MSLHGSNITDEWLAESVVPSIDNVFGNQIAAVLVEKSLLWAYFEPCMEDIVAPGVQRAVFGSFVQHNHKLGSNF